MSDRPVEIVVQSESGEAVFDSADLPLSIGAADTCEVRVPVSPTRGVVAMLGMLDGQVFIQSSKSGEPVELNGEALVGTRRLESGDEIRIASTTLSFRVESNRVPLRMSVIVTRPSPAEPVDDDIIPIRLRPAGAERGEGGRRVHPAVIGVWSGGALLVLLAWFAFTAVSVQIDVQPAPDEVELPGTLFEFELGDRFLIRPGEHTVRIEKEGYLPLEAPISVGPEADQQFSFTLQKRPGLLRVQTTPALGAEVWVDGELVGQTPLDPIELRAGPHRLEIQAPPRYRDHVSEVEVEGAGVEQLLEIALTPAWAEITLTSSPDGATVLVDGEELGTTAGSFEIMAGEHEVELRLEGYEPWRRHLTVEADQPQLLPEIALQPADGRLSLTSVPSGAQITADSSYPGVTPATLSLASGESHTIVIFKPGYEPETHEVRLEPSEQRTLAVRLAPRIGVVDLVTHPPDAKLKIDGRESGLASRRLDLLALAHRLEIYREGYVARSVTVNPLPNFPQRLKIELQTLQEHKAANTPRLLVTSRGQKLQMVEPGSFVMGAPRGERGRRPNETQHAVELTRPYYIGVAEISNREFREFAPEHRSRPFAGVDLDGDDLPVSSVRWEDAARFCNWLSRQDSLPPAYVEQGDTLVLGVPIAAGYRLPTEAEWVWAARFAGGRESALYPWGDRFPPPANAGNYADRSAATTVPNTIPSYDDGFAAAARVGAANANALGIFDFGGNVAEWVHDFYWIYPRSSSQGPARNPTGPAEGRHHSIRGSSWKHASVTELRFSFRAYSDSSREDVGFRIARYVE